MNTITEFTEVIFIVLLIMFGVNDVTDIGNYDEKQNRREI